ncbi:DUF6531 domain-containing protein [Neisseriaceae bacterium TC5R-5]|nr:DUF6531 domain-containing protein [Neisseriaceae bacterium TC5R-5]
MSTLMSHELCTLKPVSHYKITNAISGFAGYFIDVLNGQQLILGESVKDFALPGRFPIQFSRFYISNMNLQGILGKGWRCSWEVSLHKRGNEIEYCDEQGRIVIFPCLDIGSKIYDPIEKLYFAHLKDGRFVIEKPNGIYYVFFDFDQRAIARLAMIENIELQQVKFVWARNGTLLRVTGSCGHELQFMYANSFGFLSQINCVFEKNTRCITQYNYTSNARLALVRDGFDQKNASYQYSDLGLITQLELKSGLIYSNIWQKIDAQYKVVEQTNNMGLKLNLSYFKLKTEVKDNFGNIAIWQFSRDGKVKTYQDFYGRKYNIDYDNFNRLTHLFLPDNSCFLFEYDAMGRLINLSDPDGEKTRIAYYDNSLLPLMTVLPNNSYWMLQRNQFGQLISIANPAGKILKINISEDSSKKEIVDAEGGAETWEFNSWGQVISCVDSKMNVKKFQYDQNGYLIEMSDSLSGNRRLTNTSQGKLEKITYADGSFEKYEWNSNEELIGYTNALGYRQQWQRDAYGNIVKYIDEEGRVTLYSYDVYGRVILIKDARDLTYSFEWNAAACISVARMPNGVSYYYNYDKFGHLSEIKKIAVDQEQVSYYKCNINGKVIEKITDNYNIKYEYNSFGELVSVDREITNAQDFMGLEPDRLEFEYDRLSKIISEKGSYGEISLVRNQTGHPILSKLPNNIEIARLYDSMGYEAQINLNGEPVFEMAYNEHGKEILRKYGSLLTISGYSSKGLRAWRRTIPFANAEDVPFDPQNVLLIYDAKFDKAGHKISDFSFVLGENFYDYDASGRLLRRFSKDSYLERFSWDLTGNIKDLVDYDASLSKNNIVHSYKDISYEFDHWGRLIKKNKGGHQTNYEWNDDDKLIKIITDTTVTYYSYDVLGRRVKKLYISSPPANMLWQQKEPVIEETSYIWHGARLIQEINNKQVSTYLYESRSFAGYAVPMLRIDQLRNEQEQKNILLNYYHTGTWGEVLDVTNENAEILWSAQIAKNAALSKSGNSIQQNIRNTGEYFDEESNINYSLLGYVDLDTRRWISPILSSLKQSLNEYFNIKFPMGWTDPCLLVKKSEFSSSMEMLDFTMPNIEAQRQLPKLVFPDLYDHELVVLSELYGSEF